MSEPTDPKPPAESTFERQLRLAKLELEQFKSSVASLEASMEVVEDTLPFLSDPRAVIDLSTQLADANLFARNVATNAERFKRAIQSSSPSKLPELEAHKAAIEDYQASYAKAEVLLQQLLKATLEYEKVKGLPN